MTTLPNPALMDRNQATLIYSAFLGLPGLRGLWYPGSQNENGLISDMSEQGRTLTYNGNPTLGTLANGVAYEEGDGTGDYHIRLDEAGLDIIGNETTIAAGIRGLTCGGWFWWDTLHADNYYICKWVDAVQRSYLIYSNSTGGISFNISSTGAASFFTPNVQFNSGGWAFLYGRFKPSTEIKMGVNGVSSVNVTSIPATLFNSTSSLAIAGSSAGANSLDGRWALSFLAAAAWSDDILDYLFKVTRPAFGV